VEALSHPLFDRHIQTEDISIEAVAEEIGEIVGIPLHKRKHKACPNRLQKLGSVETHQMIKQLAIDDTDSFISL
jgi:hypothetical protein